MSMKPKILVVDDEPEAVELLEFNLKKAGFQVVSAPDGAQAIRKGRSASPDLIVLDLMLPEIDGLEVCKMLRRDPATSRVPIIMLTAKAAEVDRIVGLELGADDYVTKPFSPRELVARVAALIRRVAPSPENRGVLTYSSLAMDLDRHVVTDQGREVKLTAKEFLLLEYLIRNCGRVISRDVLLTDVWGYHYTGTTRTVDVHVRRLREKLPLLTATLETVKQFGYKLLESSSAASAPSHGER